MASVTGPVTADALYALIKQWEGLFPLPAPFVTVEVGTFDPATGDFNGLTTRVVTDPEPIAHGPHDHPRNPPPRFVGAMWESVVISAQWRATTTFVPAPKVPLAPVQLSFAVSSAAAPWSVTIAGLTTQAPAGQTTLEVSIWDSAIVEWRIDAGGKSHADQLRIQRPGALAGGGAFTIPVIPVAIVYAPPVDSLKRSAATYGISDTVGTTVSYDFSTDTSETTPQQSFVSFAELKNGIDVVGQVLGLMGKDFADLAKGAEDISKDMGTFTDTEQQGKVEGSGTSLTVIETSSESISTNTSGGGPGVGDVIVFYRDVQVAWAYANGELRLCPFGHELVLVTAATLATTGISPDDQAQLLALDPFVAAGPTASLDPGRFVVPDGGEVNLEYGGGVNIDQKYTVTRDSKTTTTEKTYTTDTSSWEPGPLLKLFGITGSKTQTTVTSVDTSSQDVSSTSTLDANLFAGPADHFVVSIWFDQLFGTWAFQERTALVTPVLSGSGAHAGELVKLTIGGRTFVTVADSAGRYAFRAGDIPKGAGSLAVGSSPATSVMIGGGTQTLSLQLRQKPVLKRVEVTAHVAHQGAPVAGASVAGLPGGPKTTGATGNAVFVLPAGLHRTFAVTATKAGYTAARAKLVL